MWIVLVPGDDKAWGPFLSNEAARNWAECNPVTDISRETYRVIELSSPVEESVAGEYIFAKSKVTDSEGSTYRVMLVDTEGGFERPVFRTRSEIAVDRAVRLFNAMPDPHGVRQEIMDSLGNEPMRETYGHYVARCQQRDEENGAHWQYWTSEGFEWIHTGGGCSAWWRKLARDSDGVEYIIMVTADGGACVPEVGDPFLVTITVDGEDVPEVEKVFSDEGPRSVAEAVAWAELWLSPKSKVQVCGKCCQTWSPLTPCNCKKGGARSSG